MKAITDRVEIYFGVDDLKVKSRALVNIRAKQIAAYLLRKYSRLSLKEIAPLCGAKQHSNVLFALKSADGHIVTEKKYAEDVEAIERSLISGTQITPKGATKQPSLYAQGLDDVWCEDKSTGKRIHYNSLERCAFLTGVPVITIDRAIRSRRLINNKYRFYAK